MNKDDWGNLAAFAVIAEERSFTRAATRLGVTASALSHSMRVLEERLRVRLLARTTRNVSTTDAGERLLARLRPALGDIGEALADLDKMSDRPAGRVRITAPRIAARNVIGPMLPKFSEDFPDVTVEVMIDPGFTDIIAYSTSSPPSIPTGIPPSITTLCRPPISMPKPPPIPNKTRQPGGSRNEE